jgi:F0F1-type ATP synthase beta subunit
MDKDKTSDPKPTLQLVKKESDLTIKQRAFADAIIKGKLGSFKEVYADVYDVTLTKQGKIPKWVEVEASRLMANPKVSLSIQQGLERREVNAVASTTRTRSYVLEQLMRESKEADQMSSSRVRALELLGKTCGLFSDTLEIKESRGTHDIEQDIESRIEALIRESEGNH